jgi:hypothetical protein
MAARIPPHQKVDAINLKDECQAKVREELAGLEGEERDRKIRELLESGPLGEWWKSLPKAKTPSAAGG